MPAPALRRLTYAEYLDLERTQEERHEFLDDVVVAMGGGTPRHGRVKVNVTVALANLLGSGPCLPYDSDVRVRVLETGLATYPDLTVVCGEIARHPDDADAITNPSLLVEVLSPSTQRWDRGEKFAHYRTIATLTDVLFVHPDALRVEHYHREDDGSWRLRDHRPGDTLQVLGVACAIDPFFANLPAEPPAEPHGR